VTLLPVEVHKDFVRRRPSSAKVLIFDLDGNENPTDDGKIMCRPWVMPVRFVPWCTEGPQDRHHIWSKMDGGTHLHAVRTLTMA
jgi:hypothetical protein